MRILDNDFGFKLGNHNEARKTLEQALGWFGNRSLSAELRRNRADAEKVLELKKK